jgi:DNA topoisomerase VI subunit B
MSDDDDTYAEFSDAVNMTAKQLEKWLDTDESQEVGQKKGGDGESTGHEMGRRIITLLNTSKGDLSDDDYAAMRKVVGYVKRHSAQRPDGDVTDTPWRYSLMNWGHDPLK